MGVRQRKLLRAVRILAVIILLSVALYTIIMMGKHPELSYEERIVNIVSSNRIIAVLEFILLYILKGISIFFPSAVITVAAGIIFGTPLFFFVCLAGVTAEFLIMYLFGKIIGQGSIKYLSDKYPIIKKIDMFQSDNEIFVSFLIRVTGIISYDVGSLYLGASGISFWKFLTGSIIGAVLNITLYGMLGHYMFNPLNWQLWVIILIRVGIILVSYFIKKNKLNGAKI